MLGLKLNYFSKRGPKRVRMVFDLFSFVVACYQIIPHIDGLMLKVLTHCMELCLVCIKPLIYPSVSINGIGAIICKTRPAVN